MSPSLSMHYVFCPLRKSAKTRLLTIRQNNTRFTNRIFYTSQWKHKYYDENKTVLLGTTNDTIAGYWKTELDNTYKNYTCDIVTERLDHSQRLAYTMKIPLLVVTNTYCDVKTKVERNDVFYDSVCEKNIHKWKFATTEEADK